MLQCRTHRFLEGTHARSLLYFYIRLRANHTAKIVLDFSVLCITVQNTARQWITQHDTHFTKEVNLVTIAAVRTQRVDAVSVAVRCYRTTSEPLYKFTTLTTYLNHVSLTITLAKINEEECIRHQWFTCKWVKLTEEFHIVKESATFNCQLDTVGHLVSSELTTESQLLTRTSDKLSIDKVEASCLLLQDTVKFTNRLYLVWIVTPNRVAETVTGFSSRSHERLDYIFTSTEASTISDSLEPYSMSDSR